jgi:PAS domain S-box-containing protein
MFWVISGLVYSAVYVAAVLALAGHDHTRLIVGNVGLFLPPLATLAVIVRRRDDWVGRERVFWTGMAAWAACWVVGRTGWAFDEIFRSHPLPWFQWYLVLQLTASALPLISLVAWPHRGVRSESAMTAALDILVLTFLAAFLYWSLVIAPGTHAGHSALALRSLAIVGPLVRLAALAGLLAAAASAGTDAWAAVYLRLAYGMGLAFAVLVALSMSAVRGDYQTGSQVDIGWMMPFFFAAWAAATSPASPVESAASSPWVARHSSPALLFTALMAVPVVGYALRILSPLGPPADRLRDLATAVTVVAGIALVMVRLRVERQAVEQASQRVRLLATACEQAGELIVIVTRGSRIEYANDAFCRALGYSLAALQSMPPAALVAPDSIASIAALNESLRVRRVTRLSGALLRRDGSTLQAACVAAPILDATGHLTHFVAVIRDTSEDLRLRELLVRGERLSAIGAFVSGVAHEINNPLQSIIGTLELVLARAQDPDLRVDIERIRFEAGRAGRIVRSLLTFVQPSPNERVLIDLNETVKATVAVRASDLALGGIKTREEYEPVMPLVLANRDEIQQVLLNLIINAQQAMTEGTTRALSVRTFTLGSDAVVEVHDSGPGIPPGLTGRIFEPFFSTKSTSAGPGLGLSLSLGIAHSHKGHLEHMATPSGSCFRLTLPGAGFPGPINAS